MPAVYREPISDLLVSFYNWLLVRIARVGGGEARQSDA
jgi:hypothetical protein